MADPNGFADDDVFAEEVYSEIMLRNEGTMPDDGDSAISEEDAWRVISSHFYERGLVSQQLDSFDVFMTHTMQVSANIDQLCEHSLLCSLHRLEA